MFRKSATGKLNLQRSPTEASPSKPESSRIGSVGAAAGLLLGLSFLLRLSYSWYEDEHALSRTPFGNPASWRQLANPPFSFNKRDLLLCPTCTTSVPGGYLASSFLPIVSRENLSLSEDGITPFKSPLLARYLFHHILLDSHISPVFTSDEARAELFSQALTNPDAQFAYDFAGLKPGLPTLYLYTRTGPSGRLNARRPAYMQRHVESVLKYETEVKENGHIDGTSSKERQAIWVVVEDEVVIDFRILEVLQNSGIPFIYFAHGPTRRYGKAQWNMALKAIHVVRDTFLGNGPVVSLDDDALFLPEVFSRVWRVKRVISWQVGNYYSVTSPPKSTWEGPRFKDGKLELWHTGANAERPFPIDMNGFAYNSSVLGRELPGPQYIPWDNAAGESEFLEMITKRPDDPRTIDERRQEDMYVCTAYGNIAVAAMSGHGRATLPPLTYLHVFSEPLCDNTLQDGCYLVWHNHWLPEELAAGKRKPDPPDNEEAATWMPAR